jgi:hypothetical protein
MSEQSKIFRGSLLWRLNCYGAITVGEIGAIVLAFYFAIHLANGRSPHMGVGLYYFVVISAILSLLAYFPGNLAVLYPCAVKVDPGIGLTLFGPFKAVFIPIADVLDIEKSSFTPGYVVVLSRTHGLIKRCILHRFFGVEREELAHSIRQIINVG